MLHQEIFAIFRPSEFNSDDFIAKQAIKSSEICTDQAHVHISRADGQGARGQRGGFRSVYEASGQRGSPPWLRA